MRKELNKKKADLVKEANGPKRTVRMPRRRFVLGNKAR